MLVGRRGTVALAVVAVSCTVVEIGRWSALEACGESELLDDCRQVCRVGGVGMVGGLECTEVAGVGGASCGLFVVDDGGEGAEHACVQVL